MKKATRGIGLKDGEVCEAVVHLGRGAVVAEDVEVHRASENDHHSVEVS